MTRYDNQPAVSIHLCTECVELKFHLGDHYVLVLATYDSRGGCMLLIPATEFAGWR